MRAAHSTGVFEMRTRHHVSQAKAARSQKAPRGWRRTMLSFVTAVAEITEHFPTVPPMVWGRGDLLTSNACLHKNISRRLMPYVASPGSTQRLPCIHGAAPQYAENPQFHYAVGSKIHQNRSSSPTRNGGRIRDRTTTPYHAVSCNIRENRHTIQFHAM